MSGTTDGGKRCAQTNYKNFGPDFYKVIGAIGGHNGHTGGFAANRELARIAGAKGGSISRRRRTKKQVATAKQKRTVEAAYKRLLKIQLRARKVRAQERQMAMV